MIKMVKTKANITLRQLNTPTCKILAEAFHAKLPRNYYLRCLHMENFKTYLQFLENLIAQNLRINTNFQVNTSAIIR